MFGNFEMYPILVHLAVHNIQSLFWTKKFPHFTPWPSMFELISDDSFMSNAYLGIPLTEAFVLQPLFHLIRRWSLGYIDIRCSFDLQHCILLLLGIDQVKYTPQLILHWPTRANGTGGNRMLPFDGFDDCRCQVHFEGGHGRWGRWSGTCWRWGTSSR